MVRSLSQTLDRVALLSQSISSRSPPNRLLNSRNRSNQSEKSNQIGLELGSDTDMDRISIQKLQDAVHWIIIKRAQPDWLPFVPGASYWVPPKSKARGFTDVISKLSVSISKDEVISFNTNHGWPSSEYYFEGASQSPLEMEMSCKQTSQSEDEEGKRCSKKGEKAMLIKRKKLLCSQLPHGGSSLSERQCKGNDN